MYPRPYSPPKKIAIVHEWFAAYAGSEKVVEQLLHIYPNADLYAIVDFMPEGKRQFIQNKPVKTTFIQNLPFAKTHFRHYLPLMPLAIEQFDLSSYDLILSSSHAVSKGILTHPQQLHISYVHTPIRYAWDLYHQYLNETNLNRGFLGGIVKLLMHYIRLWDFRTANGVDVFVANSKYIGRRIKKVYNKDAAVIYPPVDVEAFQLGTERQNFYLTASRMVPYKKIDLIVEAFSQMPEKELVVIGDGTEFEKIKQKAGTNVTFLGHAPFAVLAEKMQTAKAFVFAAEEDFGIIPVEAQACGAPVIAFGKGGVLESVQGLHTQQPTGVFFEEQTIESLKQAVNDFETRGQGILPTHCRDNALRFSNQRFQNEMKTFIEDRWQQFQSQLH